MRNGFTFFWLVSACVCAPLDSRGQIPAFPGADGAAALVTGGRSGIVYHVTKLDANFNDNSVGTLRYGMNDANFGGQARTIVFDVAGTFWLGRFGADRGHDNGWDTQSRLNLGSNITIAGQTAPGPVHIMGGLVKAGSNNVVLRNVTVAPGYGMRNFEKPDESPPELPTPGDFPDSYVFDAIDITGTDIMIDHVSTLYATDETISANEFADDVTIQYANISQGQNYPQADAEASGVRYTGHALGSLLQAGSNANISVHHNLYAHQKGRLPRVGSEVGTGAFNDFRNNVFYNWLGTAGGGAGGQPSFNNFIGNFFLAGPGGDDPVGGTSTAITTRSGGTGIFNGGSSSATRVHHAGNLKDTNKDGDPDDGAVLTNSDFGSSSFQAAAYGQTPYYGTTDAADVAFERVLAYMGDRWWDRSDADRRIVEEVRAGTGQIVAWADNPFNDYPDPPEGFLPYDPDEGAEWRSMLALRADPATGTAPFVRPNDWDTDRDGMPDYWEREHGLSADVANNNDDFDSDGYTDLEEYLNDLAAWPAPRPLAFVGTDSSRFAEIGNWDIPWQPSRFDLVLVDNHAVEVDAVGQHAGTVWIGISPGGASALDINDGWLKVTDAGIGLSTGEIVIGAEQGAAAALNLSGGELYVDVLSKFEPTSQFNFTGGQLHAGQVNFELDVSGGTISPGASIGTTNIAGNMSAANSSTIEIEIDGPLADLVSVVGDLDLGSDSALHVIALSEPTAASYLFAQYTGQLFGEFAIVTPGYTVDYDTPGEIRLLLAETVLAGDYNDDGIVNAADYVTWRNNLGAGSLPNETVSIGEIDAADYEVWRDSFQAQAQAASTQNATVPEPGTMLLLLIVISVAIGRIR
jgi:pectate lyase